MDTEDDLRWEAYLRDRHHYGLHDEEPHDDCPLCPLEPATADWSNGQSGYARQLADREANDA